MQSTSSGSCGQGLLAFRQKKKSRRPGLLKRCFHASTRSSVPRGTEKEIAVKEILRVAHHGNNRCDSSKRKPLFGFRQKAGLKIFWACTCSLRFSAHCYGRLRFSLRKRRGPSHSHKPVQTMSTAPTPNTFIVNSLNHSDTILPSWMCSIQSALRLATLFT